MKRRTFLRHAGHSMAVPAFLGGWGINNSLGQSFTDFLRLAHETDRVLVLIYLEGGNDGLNTLVPLVGYRALQKVRPHIILPENELLKSASEDYAWHPALSGLRSLYNEGRLQVIHSAGYPEQNFSHFRSTDIWMSGSDANKLVTSGWTGRYLENLHPNFPADYPNGQHPHPLAVEMGHGASMLFQGERNGFSMVINEVENFYRLLDLDLEEGADPKAGDKLRHIRLMARQSQKYGEEVKKAAEKTVKQKPYPEGNKLAQQLKIVSRLIAGGLNTPLYLVRLGSFDTHDNQVEESNRKLGTHAALLKQLDEGILAFMQDLEYLGSGDRVMGMTFSEFGRRIVSNASLGTDHGTAAPLLIFGNKSHGGNLGKAPLITGEEEYRDNLPIQHDFRQIYTSLLSQWFSTDKSTSEIVTKGEFDQVPVVANKIRKPSNHPENPIKVYPNPAKDYVKVEFKVKQGYLRLELIDMNGKTVARVAEGQWDDPSFEEMVDLTFLPAGRYIFRLWEGGRFYSHHVIKL